MRIATQTDKSGFRSLADIQAYFADKKVCENHLAQMRWEGGKPVCPHCGCDGRIYTMKYNFKCGDCRKQFSVTKGTIFESSHISLKKWFIAMWLLTSHKKGISSMQLSRDLGVTQKTAWFMLQRIRFAVRTSEYNSNLKNEVEADETYIGGKDRNRHASKRNHMSGGADKTPVMGIVERNGMVIATRVKNTSGRDLKPIIMKHVAKGSTIYTDEHSAYSGLNKLDYGHSTITHSQGQYVDGRTHTNTIEGFWSLLKRGIVGIYHQISVKHLDKYLDEFEFRYNTREMACAERFCYALGMSNCRLTYDTLIGKWMPKGQN